MKIRARLLHAAVISLLAFAGSASATTIETTSYQTWVNSLTGSPTDGFSYVASGTYNTSAGWSTTIGSYGKFTVTGPDNGAYSLYEASYGSNSALVATSDGIGGLLVTSANGVTGIMLGLGLNGNTNPLNITLSDGETFTLNPTVGGTTLFGISTSAPITSVYVSTAAGSAVVLNDLLAGVSNLPASSPSSPVAECATILLIAGGLLFLGAKRKIFSNVTSSHA